MSFEQIVLELKKLNHADKLRAMQVLVMALSAEENAGVSLDAQYEILTPYGNDAAAQVLYDFLQVSKLSDQS